MVIKVTTPWKNNFLYNTIYRPDLYDMQLPNRSFDYQGYRFEVNNECNECDIWFIYGGLYVGDFKEEVKCARENIIYITDESHCNRFYVKSFIDQFATVVSPRKDITHKNVINFHEILVWYLDKDYDELYERKSFSKTKQLCIINSNLTDTPLQRLRYELTHKLIGHFKDRIDVYGRGFKTFDDKFDLLKDYKYCLSIENTSLGDYFTEKIFECYLTHTMPVYFGCPNINDYFDKESYIEIDPYNYQKTIDIIEKLLIEDPYGEKIDKIISQKVKYLENYSFFAAIVRLVGVLNIDLDRKKIKNTIYKEDYFKRGYWARRLLTIYNNRKFIPKKYKITIDFNNDDKYAN